MRSDGPPSVLDELLPDPSRLEREELEAQAHALSALLRISAAVQRASDFDELVERAVEAIAQYTRYPSVALFRVDHGEGMLHLLAARGFNAEAEERARRLPLAGSLTGVAVTQRTVVTSHNLHEDARVEPATQKALASDGFREVACVPLFQGDEAIGALNLIYRDRAGLEDSELQILSALGQIVGMAMSARLAAEERARLEARARRTQQIESLGLFAGGIAHDFNNILTGILGNVSLVRELLGLPPATQAAQLLFDAERACQRAAELVGQLLTFSRGGAPLKRPTRELATLVEEAARFATAGASVALDFRATPIAGTLEVDPGQIMQVVHNLVLNAVQASPSGATVSVRVGPSGASSREAEISVEDRGSGIAPADLPRIFEPYFTTRVRGSGLGLATTQSIVLQHDGHIAVESVLGQGSRFVVRLPLAHGEHEEAPTPAAPPARSLAGLRILVLDDEPLVSRLLARMLQGFGSVTVLTARGEETIDAFAAAKQRGEAFDLVILDLTVSGGLGGKDTLERLRLLDPHVRAVASSGYSSDDVLARPDDFGFRAILPKPYTREALVAALSAALAPVEPEGGTQANAGTE